MIGLPHRVGAAYVILGQSNGTEPRAGHILNDAVYGDASALQFHTYFGNYPTTTPDAIITKTAGTIGEDYYYVSATNNNIPGNVLKLVSYKTKLNHYVPTKALDYSSDTPSWDSSPHWATFTPENPSLNSGRFLNESYIYYDEITDIASSMASWLDSVVSSYTEITDETDNLDGSVENFVSSVFYPRWTAETGYDNQGNLFPPIQVSVADGDPFYQTREGPGMTAPAYQVGLPWICPWAINSNNGSGISQYINIDCNVSYKFTNDGDHERDSVAFKIVYYRDKGDWNDYFQIYDPVIHNELIPDKSAYLKSYDTEGFYAGKINEGTYRNTRCKIWPCPSGSDYPYVNYENTATHGLFLDANGSCWNIGTEIKVKVHIWKAPPKFCLYYRNKEETGGGLAYVNWKTGIPAYGSTPATYVYYKAFNTTYPAYYQEDKVCHRIFGPASGSPYDGTFKFEGGVDSGVEYTESEPTALNLHYWGTVFTIDTDSELCVEHDVREFTVTIGEDNTYYCDGELREGVEMTPNGFKVADVVIPAVEGYITYIKDFEVTSVKKPPATAP